VLSVASLVVEDEEDYPLVPHEQGDVCLPASWPCARVSRWVLPVVVRFCRLIKREDENGISLSFLFFFFVMWRGLQLFDSHACM
jgi:hypothetical protein